MIWLTALGLCVAGLGAIIVEFFVPAGGIIGLLGLGSIIGGVVVAFSEYGTVIGSAFLLGALILTPLAVVLYFKFLPGSFLGRRLILGLKHSDGLSGKPGSASGVSEVPDPGFADLEGARGTAVSALRPAGIVRIDKRKYSVVTGGEFLERGCEVRVTRVEGNRIYVRKVET